MRGIVCLASMPLLFLAGHAQERPTGRGEAENADGYVVFQRGSLVRELHGADGQLRLLQDARLPTTPRDRLWGQLAPEIGDLWIRFKSDPANAVLRIVERTGSVVQAKRFDQPLAEMEMVKLYGDARISYLITVACSAGFGSYSGPITSLVEVVGGKLKWVEALDKVTRKSELVNLMRSLKSVWKVADAQRGQAKDILSAACRPSESAFS